MLESRWYAARTGAGIITEPSERRAAQLAAAHANTPSVTHLDSLGRAFRVEADLGPNTPDLSTHVRHATTTEFDIEGNTLAITDALGIRTIEQQFDVLGRRIAVTSPDAGARLTVADAAGAPLRSWDSRGQTMWSQVDALRRPTHVYVRRSGEATASVVSRTIYGESLDGNGPLAPQDGTSVTPTLAQLSNLRGQTHLVFDGAGLAKSEAFDFKGNLLRSTRHLAAQYREVPSWSNLPELSETTSPAEVEGAAINNGLLEPTTIDVPTRFTTSTAYDALNRVVESSAPDGSVSVPVYNRANFLERMLVTAGGATRAVVHSMEYNEKGQRLECEYSGEANLQSTAAYRTRYTYDPETFRLQTLITVRAGTGVVLQSLHYTYDPVGNIVEILDNGAPVPIYASAHAQAHGRYEYDALYRLTAAEGREHPGQQMDATDAKPGELPIALPGPNDTSGLVGYVETYEYDAVGNIRRMHHQPDGYTAWERRYLYANMPESGATVRSNRLLATSNPGDVDGVYSARYAYADGTDPSDPTNNAGLHGSMTRMPHLPSIQWNYADRMQSCTQTVGPNGGTVYFTYDASGQRVRKVYEHGQYREERIYLGGYEVYRRLNSGTLDVHRTTLHAMDDQRRVAMVENTIVDPKVSAGRRWRFQLDNHLGTATLEVDHEGNVISYEEYHPYGTSAVKVQRSGAGFSQKRYRYTGKERDEETGLYYHGARYYAPWLGRWTAADPLGVAQPGKADLNVYAYVRGRPLYAIDLTGMEDSLPDPAQFATFDEFAAAAPSPYGTAYLMERWESVHGANSVAPTQSDFLDGAPQESEPNKSKVASDAAESSEGSNLAGSSAVTAYESSVRSEYLRQIKTASAEAVSEIDKIIAAAKEGTITEVEALEQAEHVARAASAKRDTLRAAAQSKLLPGGRMLSEAIERPMPFEQRLAMKGGPTLSGYRAVAVSAGKSRAIVSAVAKFGKIAGPVGLAIGGGLGVKAVLEAPAEQQASVAVEEGAALGASALGATGGTALGVAGAGGIAGVLGISGPPGWLVLGLGLIGGLGGGYFAGEGVRKGVRYAQGRER
ncbi:MAG: RHS repeat-associated core domain-containing protein [Polyangiaceae bacterium]